MSDILDTFVAERDRMFKLAYGMLGTRALAEEVVQEAWIRARAATDVRRPEAWLTTVVTRLALEHQLMSKYTSFVAVDEEVRYDPERMQTIEVWHGQTFQERVRLLEVTPSRRPRATHDPIEPDPEGPVVDYLGHLAARHEPLDTPDRVEAALAERRAQDAAVAEVFERLLDPEVFDRHEVLEFTGRYGPFDPDAIEEHLRFAVEMGGSDQHIHTVLCGLRDALGGQG